MYYRRKVLLALLEKFGGILGSTRLQKLLFLFTRKQEVPSYEFVPYKFGAYSFQVQADKKTLTKYDLLEDNKKWVIKTGQSYIEQLTNTDRDRLNELHKTYADYSTDSILTHTYRTNPYYAINSVISDNILDQEDRNRIALFRPQNSEKKLYTIGYEGIKAETFMNRLIGKNICLLVDVRKNSMSMKFGFSKSQLQTMCKSMNIAFMHMPELGIDSSKRKDLRTEHDYKKLFEEYERETLSQREDALETLECLIRKYDRVALTCFEKHHKSCHRHKISDQLNQKYTIQVEHI